MGTARKKLKSWELKPRLHRRRHHPGQYTSNDLQILVEWPMRIDPKKRTIGTETREEISRRLRTTEAGPLREDCIHARCIVAGSSANISYLHYPQEGKV